MDSELTKIKLFYLALWCTKAEKQTHSKALFHDEKEKSSSSSTASGKIGPVNNKEPNNTFLVDQSYLNFLVAKTSAQRSTLETTPQLSSNSSSF